MTAVVVLVVSFVVLVTIWWRKVRRDTAVPLPDRSIAVPVAPGRPNVRKSETL